MDRWSGKTALVTGASSGIGEVLARRLAAVGVRVLAVARRLDRLETLKEEIEADGGEVEILQCDLGDEGELKAVFSWIEGNWGHVNILINNAGHMPWADLTDENIFSKMKRVLEVNVVALCACAKETVALLNNNQVTEGHIININSVAGHRIVDAEGLAPYCASKHAARTVSSLLRCELGRHGSSIRVTNISPGMTRTELQAIVVEKLGAPDSPILEPDDVADCVLFCLSAPPHVNVSELTLQATDDIFMRT